MADEKDTLAHSLCGLMLGEKGDQEKTQTITNRSDGQVSAADRGDGKAGGPGIGDQEGAARSRLGGGSCSGESFLPGGFSPLWTGGEFVPRNEGGLSWNVPEFVPRGQVPHVFQSVSDAGPFPPPMEECGLSPRGRPWEDGDFVPGYGISLPLAGECRRGVDDMHFGPGGGAGECMPTPSLRGGMIPWSGEVFVPGEGGYMGSIPCGRPPGCQHEVEGVAYEDGGGFEGWYQGSHGEGQERFWEGGNGVYGGLGASDEDAYGACMDGQNADFYEGGQVYGSNGGEGCEDAPWGQEGESYDDREEIMLPCWVLWIGSLEPRVDENDLLNAFSDFGPIMGVLVKSQQQDGVYAGLGFVNFLEEESAKTAYECMNGTEILGRPIKTRPPQLKEVSCSSYPLNPPPEHITDEPDAPDLDFGEPVGCVTVPMKKTTMMKTVIVSPLLTLSFESILGDRGDAISWAEKAASANEKKPGVSEAARDKVEEGLIGKETPLGDFFCCNLWHPSDAFRACQAAGETRSELLKAVQYGGTRNGVQFVSFRGFTTWAADIVLDEALAKVQIDDYPVRCVVIAGVGGTDTRTGTHKHSSHTKGGTLEREILGLLCASKMVYRPAKIVPLYTSRGNTRFYGSFLIRIIPRKNLSGRF